MREAEVVVLGAGVAGLTLARLLWEGGRSVLVVAEALGEASRPPVALVNPLRGRRFTLAEEGERALEAALAFYGRFVSLHLEVYRPVPERERDQVAKRLGGLRHRWEGGGVVLEEAFWLEPRPLLERLARGVPLLKGRVLAWEPPYLCLEGGERVRGEILVYAGGGRGAHLLGLGGRHVPGLVLTLLDYFPRAISYRVYLAGSALGGSYLSEGEGPDPPPPTKGEVAWLLEGAEALVGYRPQVASAWRGVRFRLPAQGEGLPYLFPVEGGYALTGLGSTGFLYAPLLVGRLAGKL
ncbi:oxidoreductase [Thermus brockianus]|uniref:Oxidoreductase n=2 Tax=Thermus brockianus TaxID=56956 RepID=A0ABM7XK25_THEBO|nr:oxidoreductase [Thermus brockianus]